MDEQSEVVRRALDYPYAVPQRSFVQVGLRTLAPSEVEVDLSTRIAVLAYGANAAPEALGRKLAPDSDPAPVLRTALSGFDVVYSAHISPYGSLPATLLRSSGTEVDVFVAYLTAAQLELVSATEPNYDLTTLEPGCCRCGEADIPDDLLAFESRHGCLQIDGSAVALAAVGSRGRALPEMDQRQLLGRLRAVLRPGCDLEAFAAECAAGRVSLRDLA